MGDHSSDTSPEETEWFSTDERSNLHIAKKIQDIQSWNTMIGNEDTTGDFCVHFGNALCASTIKSGVIKEQALMFD